MIVLGVETSCDDTSLAILSSGNGSLDVLASKTFSQTDIHTLFGGIVPEVASRNHVLKIKPLFGELIMSAGIAVKDIDLIGVTNRPGLIGSLFVGVSFAKGLSYALNVPLVPVNHIHAHIFSAEMSHPDLRLPYLALVVSGGHTHMYLVDGECRLIGRTVDDAVGEAFDKVAKMLGGPYPGGPFVENMARSGDELALSLPFPMKNGLNFSFSGLKTAVMNIVNKDEYEPADIAAAFQRTVAEVLLYKSVAACKEYKLNKIVISGGVSCNSYIREYFEDKQPKSMRSYFPSHHLCTDNGDMIAYAALKSYDKGEFGDMGLTAYDSM